MTKLRDLFDLPERVNPGDFVLKALGCRQSPESSSEGLRRH
jgi:hypothetical protein